MNTIHRELTDGANEKRNECKERKRGRVKKCITTVVRIVIEVKVRVKEEKESEVRGEHN